MQAYYASNELQLIRRERHVLALRMRNEALSPCPMLDGHAALYEKLLHNHIISATMPVVC